MWELDCEESWAPKNWYFWIVVLEKTRESPLDFKESQTVHPKWNKSWICIGRTDVEAKLQYLVTWYEELTHLKRPWCWKDWGQEENEVIGWHHGLNKHKFEEGSWWWTGRPGVLWSMGSQRVGHNQVTELTELKSGDYQSWHKGQSTHMLSTRDVHTLEISSEQLSHSVLSDSLWPHGLQHISNSWSFLKLMSIELVMPSNHLILCCPLLLPPSIFPSIRVFSNESVLHIRWPKCWSFNFSISPSNEYWRLISFRID